MSRDRPSLKRLVLRGSGLIIASHGSGQLIRLARSLILTRLLFPEAFGLMSLVWVVMFGLGMLSDLGVGPAIIRDKRGDDPEFLNTAWTFQTIRGVVLSGVACLIAYPMAAFYNEPDLALLIPAAGMFALIAGFNSTAFHTCRRRMEFERLAVLELANEVVAFAITVLWALIDPSVWALVGGALVAQLFLTLASHAYLPGTRNRFRWERSSLRVLIDFGKWVYLNSAFQLVAAQSDRLLLGYYLAMAQLGVYSIAIMLCEAVQVLANKVIRGALFPAYSRIVQHEAYRLRSVFHRGRLGIDVLLVLPIAALMVMGSWIVSVLYDVRYHDAGWMFQVLCIRPLMASALINSEVCLVALGHPQYGFVQSAFRAFWILVSIPIGWLLGGIPGVIWAVALSEVPVLGVLWFGLARHGMFSLQVELRSICFAGLGAILGLGMLRLVS